MNDRQKHVCHKSVHTVRFAVIHRNMFRLTGLLLTLIHVWLAPDLVFLVMPIFHEWTQVFLWGIGISSYRRLACSKTSTETTQQHFSAATKFHVLTVLVCLSGLGKLEGFEADLANLLPEGSKGSLAQLFNFNFSILDQTVLTLSETCFKEFSPRILAAFSCSFLMPVCVHDFAEVLLRS